MRSGAVLAVAALWLQAACYNYLPPARSHLVPSTYLVVTLTDAGSEELTRYVGPDVHVVRGRLLRAPDERSLALSVAAVETGWGLSLQWNGETVVVPREFVRGIQRRQAARGKTVLLAGALLSGFFVASAAFGPGRSGTASSGDGSGPVPR
jgi:hypothetical protein